MGGSPISIAIATLEARLIAIFTAHNTAAPIARRVAAALIDAELMGQGGHGLSRVTSYAAQARSGKIDGHAVPLIVDRGAAYLRVDAARGFAYPALDLAIDNLRLMATETGIASAVIFNSHHAGMLALPVSRLAEAGLMALMFANTPKAMAPWGGSKAVFGTNPIAFAAPLPNGDPIVIDMALSKVARGKIMAANKAGRAIPEGWALDIDGQPTTDAARALGGTMVPMADAKGAALALMVEILAATLTGALHSFEASSFFDAEGAPPSVGQMMIAIDPARLSGGAYDGGIVTLAQVIGEQAGARLPGIARQSQLRAARALGQISIDPAIYAELQLLG